MNVFDATTTSVVAGSRSATANVGQEADGKTRVASAERVDQQRRSQHRAADADVQDSVDLAERPRFDRIDQRAHP